MPSLRRMLQLFQARWTMGAGSDGIGRFPSVLGWRRRALGTRSTRSGAEDTEARHAVHSRTWGSNGLPVGPAAFAGDYGARAGEFTKRLRPRGFWPKLTSRHRRCR